MSDHRKLSQREQMAYATISRLEAKLAERDALLIESHDLLNSGHLAAASTYARQRAYSLIDKIKTVLSASAEPEVKP